MTTVPGATSDGPLRPLNVGDIVVCRHDVLGEWVAAPITEIDPDWRKVGVLELDWSGPEPSTVDDVGTAGGSGSLITPGAGVCRTPTAIGCSRGVIGSLAACLWCTIGVRTATWVVGGGGTNSQGSARGIAVNTTGAIQRPSSSAPQS